MRFISSRLGNREFRLDCEQSLIFLLRHGRMRARETRERARGGRRETRAEPEERRLTCLSGLYDVKKRKIERLKRLERIR